MGKNLQEEEPVIALEHGNPGCMKGILHHFNHRKWYHVKMRLPLPHKRSNGGKSASVVEDPLYSLSTANAGQVQEKFEAESAKSSSINGRSSESGSGHKSSMKSRLKALISEEVYRRKGRHHRSASCPTQIPLDTGPPAAETGSRNYALNRQGDTHSLACGLLDPLLPRTSGESANTCETCPLCAAKNTKNYLSQSEVNGLGDHPVKDHTLLRDESVYAIEPSKIASLQESKLFFDALDLLNIRKELFLKVLQDPNSSMSNNQRVSTSRSGLTKSVSFPMPGSSARRAPPSNSSKPQFNNKGGGSATASKSSKDLRVNLVMETGISADGDAPKPPLPRNDSLDIASSPKELKKQNVNKLIMKRFKNLRAKIKHAIRESRKERQRIVMDGFLHKIPYGYPKNAKEEGRRRNDIVAQNWCKYSPGDGSRNDQFFAGGNGQTDIMRRTASFNEPLSRYNRLIELYFYTEANNQTYESDESSSKKAGGSPASMARILSMPDLRCHSFSRVERWPAASSLEMPVKPDFSEANKKLSTLRKVSFADQIRDVDDILHDPKMEKDATGTESAISSTAPDSELVQEVEPDEEDSSLKQQQTESSFDFPSSQEASSIGNETETPRRQSYNVQVDMKNRADFNYVRDVMELSGFTRTEVLGKWHSDEQPVNPLVFDEVEGCLLAQPDCSGNCSHLLLFDLINEVLLEIYGKTFSYWPKLLTCCSQIHPMPVGYHLLEDVWGNINWYLQRRPDVDPSLDDAVSHDLSKSDGWMNVQFEAECVGIELEDWIFDDLLDELAFPELMFSYALA